MIQALCAKGNPSHVVAFDSSCLDCCVLCSVRNQGQTESCYGRGRLSLSPGGALFSPAERSFLGVLDQAVGTDYRVFGKVRVADVASVKPGLGNSARQGALNRIAQKHFDFVVCGARDLNIVCAVELDAGDFYSGSASKSGRPVCFRWWSRAS